MIGAAELRDLCLALPGSAETFPFGPETSVFKVAGKMFALARLAEHPLRVSLKCEPQLAARTVSRPSPRPCTAGSTKRSRPAKRIIVSASEYHWAKPMTRSSSITV
jgi:hypothetical protein